MEKPRKFYTNYDLAYDHYKKFPGLLYLTKTFGLLLRTIVMKMINKCIEVKFIANIKHLKNSYIYITVPQFPFFVSISLI